jgi:hypothetical protein
MFNGTLHNNIINKFATIELAKPKDVLVVVDERIVAEDIKQNIIDNSANYEHNQTGKMERSIGVRNMGNGEWGVTAIDYAKYVNGRDREKSANNIGFIDEAIDQAINDFDLEPGDVDIRYEQE